jgi:virulence-associated protein VagC
MTRRRTARLKTSGSDQFVLIPADFRLGAGEVEIVRDGDEVILRRISGRKASYRRGSKRLVLRDGLRSPRE